MTVQLVPGRVTLAELERIYRQPVPFAVSAEGMRDVEQGAARLAAGRRGTAAIYGVNTGFGKLASVRISDDHLESLQRNLVRSHAAGYGEPLSAPVVRLVMALKCVSLGRGASGVRPEIIALLQQLAASDVLPVIPAQGSVGASGDLAPLSHMAATMFGEG